MADRISRRIALIGASGWLGRSIGLALLRKGISAPDDLICVNRSGPSADYAEWPDLRWETDLARGMADADTVILSVRPGEFRAASFAGAGKLLISLMAGIGCAEITARTGAGRVVRAMPNAAVEIGRSYSPWCATPAVDEADSRHVGAILNAVGDADRLDSEDEIDIVTALSGAGPAYGALLASALLKAARATGLPERIAARAVEAAVRDSAPLLESGAADDMIDSFIGYEGTTAAVLKTARTRGFDEVIASAVAAGVAKAREMKG
ncbi:MAG: pyrroline-5-carboxylate reductase family protein [Pikeienuella sp.]